MAPEPGAEKGAKGFFNSVPCPLPGHPEAMKMVPSPTLFSHQAGFFSELRHNRILGNLGTEVALDFARGHHTDRRPEGVGCSSHGVCTRGGLWGLS